MSLDQLRKKIDQIDEKLVELINERARVVVEVGKLKQSEATPIYVPHREKAVIDKIGRINQGPLPDKTLSAIWREIMSGSCFLVPPVGVGDFGPQRNI